MFEPGTHRVVHIPNCIVQHPLINHVAATVRRSLVDAGVTCYSETAHAGVARYLQVVVERSSGTAQVVLVANAASPEPLTECLGLIRARLGRAPPQPLVQLPLRTFECDPGSGVRELRGPAECHRAVRRSLGALSAGRVRPEQPGHCRTHRRSRTPASAGWSKRRGVLCGRGRLGLSLLPHVGRIRMNEVSPQSLLGLELGLAGLDAASRTKVEVVPGPAGSACSAADGMDVVIADPPRKGLDRELVERAACSHRPGSSTSAAGWSRSSRTRHASRRMAGCACATSLHST